MSLDLKVYAEKLEDQIISKWLGRMNQFDMECELHPDFSFDYHNGFLPFKIKLKNPNNTELVGRQLISGFEFHKEKFSYERELEILQPKRSFLQRLIAKPSKITHLASPEIDARLSNCKWVLTFNWGSHDTLELRMSSLSSAIIAELTNGVCCYPADDIWYDNKTIVEEAFRESLEFENSLKPSEWRVHEFTGWNE